MTHYATTEHMEIERLRHELAEARAALAECKQRLAEWRAKYESVLAQLQALSQPSAYERGLADALKTVREAK